MYASTKTQVHASSLRMHLQQYNKVACGKSFEAFSLLRKNPGNTCLHAYWWNEKKESTSWSEYATDESTRIFVKHFILIMKFLELSGNCRGMFNVKQSRAETSAHTLVKPSSCDRTDINEVKSSDSSSSSSSLLLSSSMCELSFFVPA